MDATKFFFAYSFCQLAKLPSPDPILIILRFEIRVLHGAGAKRKVDLVAGRQERASMANAMCYLWHIFFFLTLYVWTLDYATASEDGAAKYVIGGGKG